MWEYLSLTLQRKTICARGKKIHYRNICWTQRCIWCIWQWWGVFFLFLQGISLIEEVLRRRGNAEMLCLIYRLHHYLFFLTMYPETYSTLCQDLHFMGRTMLFVWQLAIYLGSSPKWLPEKNSCRYRCYVSITRSIVWRARSNVWRARSGPVLKKLQFTAVWPFLSWLFQGASDLLLRPPNHAEYPGWFGGTKSLLHQEFSGDRGGNGRDSV